ncbi:MAG: DNA primase [Asgard group archaeon]|nr:DNA primase [Asgard group archaeon]
MPKNDNTKNQHNNVVDEATTTKYMIQASFTIDGLVEKPDVVGALFGQTEGLVSEDLDLRELQKSGRVGRIQVNLSFRGGKTKGSLEIPSSLDKVETSILAATIETVDRIGPCSAQIQIKKIEDIRIEKMKKIRERASELLLKWNSEASQDSSDLADEVSKIARGSGITQYAHLPAGPELIESDTIIIVEGRADIAACLRAGVRNTIAVQGASIPRSVSELTKKKTTIAFLDGDRGGDLILKELLMYSDIDFVVRAPKGQEVEDLKPDEIIKYLSNKVPIEKITFTTEIHANDILDRAIKRVKAKRSRAKTPVKKDMQVPAVKVEAAPKSIAPKAAPQSRAPQRSTDRRPYQSDRRRPSSQSRGRPQRRSYDQRDRRPPPPKIPDELLDFVKDIDGKEKQEGILLNEKLKEIKRIPVSSLFDELKKTKGVTKIVFDGVITQRLLNLCAELKIATLVGARTAKLESKPASITYYTFA